MSKSDMKRPRPAVLCVLDGWGYRDKLDDNAVTLAHTPNLHRFWKYSPHALLEASEEWVGLPSGQIGNSEVGHMNLGAGRVVMQDLPRIDAALANGEFPKIPALAELIRKVKASGGECHILGLVSEGGVHSHQSHIAGLAKTLDEAGIPVVIHALTDGRDVPPQAAEGEIGRFLKAISGAKSVKIGTLGGRYYAMDRDKRWDRVALAYKAIVSADAPTQPDALTAIRESYAAGKNDEFILPAVIEGYTGMKDGDALIVANFRADRARQISAALLDPEFDEFPRGKIVRFVATASMAEYSSSLNKLMPVMFPPQSLDKGFGEIVAEAGLRQLRAAETEKYPHVTFFFNGGREQPYEGEERIMVASPKVATYDLQPAMSAAELARKVVAAIDTGDYDVVVMNFANCDMVGHTGMLEPAIKAVEAVDDGVAQVVEAIRRQGGFMFLTADHGNAEQMHDPTTNGPHTAHTLNRVPAILIDGPPAVKLKDGRLADVAPTLLALMGFVQPAEMTGVSLLEREPALAG
ncbi:MAG TPA: 2,3-bisphosphoglycerate-independent phosphoglycerate mutase [Alphaproteobacteria bacterium]|nr:2,3-bisphosphoglycerate-independent phosphoglycerate mutase [Alphaproteobacteria bacterium]